MTGKHITIGTRPSKQAPPTAHAWVEDRNQGEALKRLTIDIPLALHSRIKADCAMRGRKMADELRELLTEKYGKA